MAKGFARDWQHLVTWDGSPMHFLAGAECFVVAGPMHPTTVFRNAHFARAAVRRSVKYYTALQKSPDNPRAYRLWKVDR